MKIGIIAPSPVPFVIGGAENLWAGMLAAFNRQPGIECELIKLPSPERNFAEVLASYRYFAQLDLNHFDLLISTKYPAWAVRHPNHIVYLQHKLRGLYDTYPAQLPTQLDPSLLERANLPRALWPLLTQADHSAANMASRDTALRDTASHDIASLDIAEIVTQLLPLVQNQRDAAAFSFPGPLTRAILHLLDRIALHPSRICRYAAISRTVGQRADYFPQGVAVDVMHHPSSLEPAPAKLSSAPLAPIFSASRLDGPKRIDMIVQAWQRAGIQRPLRLAGDGPQREALQQLAAGNPGIQFLGRLTDAELAREYAQAAFVVFVPQQEDYGLITIEAMAAHKPVLTTSDAGGVTELVEHGNNGFIVAPNADALANGMRKLDADSMLRQQMGEAGAARVSGIHWQGLVEFLLAGSGVSIQASGHHTQQANQATHAGHAGHDRASSTDDRAALNAARAAHIARAARPRYVVVNTFQLTPVTSGGQVRLYGLYRALARFADIHFVNLAAGHLPHTLRELHPGLVEEVVPVSKAFVQAEKDLERVVNASVGDLAAALYPNLLDDWVRAIAQTTRKADAVICSHPYGHPAVVAAGWQGPSVYEAHNVECDLKRGIYAGQPWPTGLIERFERDCARSASHITACSESERDRLIELYGVARARCAVIANGIALDAVPYISPAARRGVRQSWGQQKPLALFMGSAHQPNVEAAALIVAAAAQCPTFEFALMGSVCLRIDRQRLPNNLRLLGVVDDTEKLIWLKIASVGLNPIISGAGTNLKLAEYAAAGLPIVSTAFGARGGVLLPDTHITVCDGDANSLAQALQRWFKQSDEEHQAQVSSAWQRVRETLDWEKIALSYAEFLMA